MVPDKQPITDDAAGKITRVEELAYELSVGEVMTKKVFTLRPDQTMREALDDIKKHRISGAPVAVDGNLLGILSIEDLIRSLRDGRIEAFFEANQEFHLRIQELAGNRWLVSVIQDLRKVLKMSRLHSLSLEGRLQQSLNEHRAIMAAFKAADATKAEALMHDHLLSGREALVKMDAKAAKAA